MHFYIYKIIDTQTLEYYIGKRASDVPPHLDSYTGSGKNRLCRSAKKCLNDRYKKEILVDGIEDLETLSKIEAQIVTIELIQSDSKCLNLVAGGNGGGNRGLTVSDETRLKMSQASTGRSCKESAKLKLSIVHTGKKLSPETIEKLKERKKHITPETREKMRQAKLGKKREPHSHETIEKMRQAKLGKKRSSETIEKMRQANLGKKASEESKKKLRQTWAKKKLEKQSKIDNNNLQELANE